MYFKKWVSQFYIYKWLSVVDFEEFCEAWQHGSVRRRGIKRICFYESSYPFSEPCECMFDSLCDGIGCELRDLPHAFAQVFKMFCQYFVFDVASNPYSRKIRRNENESRHITNAGV